jgi:hypothetical protein
VWRTTLATASIGGIVTDPSGSTVAGAILTLTNTGQGTVRAFTTQNDGSFSFTTLEAASYSLTVSAPSGFEKWKQAIVINIGQNLDLPIRLRVAGSETSVQVAASAVQSVDTTTSVVAGVIDAHQIEALPLNGRNYLGMRFSFPAMHLPQTLIRPRQIQLWFPQPGRLVEAET